MSIRRSRGPTRCPTCQRTKSEAIEEQVSKKRVCDCPTCIFRSDIQKAIDDSTRIKIVKKDLPKINICKKEHTINIKRKPKINICKKEHTINIKRKPEINIRKKEHTINIKRKPKINIRKKEHTINIKRKI